MTDGWHGNDGMSVMEALRGSREPRAGRLRMPGGSPGLAACACLVLASSFTSERRKASPSSGFPSDTHTSSKWYRRPKQHTTNRRAGSMDSRARMLLITLTSVSFSKSILKPRDNRRGITWERRRGFGCTQGKETKQPQGRGPREIHTQMKMAE